MTPAGYLNAAGAGAPLSLRGRDGRRPQDLQVRPARGWGAGLGTATAAPVRVGPGTARAGAEGGALLASCALGRAVRDARRAQSRLAEQRR